MPYRAILANLLADARDASAVLFLDEAGDPIEVLSSSLEADDLKLASAYLGIRLKQISSAVSEAGLGETRHLHIERGGQHLHVESLSEGYYLVLVQDRPGLVEQARRCLDSASTALRTELFREPVGD